MLKQMASNQFVNHLNMY